MRTVQSTSSSTAYLKLAADDRVRLFRLAHLESIVTTLQPGGICIRLIPESTFHPRTLRHIALLSVHISPSVRYFVSKFFHVVVIDSPSTSLDTKKTTDFKR